MKNRSTTNRHCKVCGERKPLIKMLSEPKCECGRSLGRCPDCRKEWVKCECPAPLDYVEIFALQKRLKVE